MLYVGKAGNLNKRIRSYKHKRNLEPRIQLMLKLAKRLKWIRCESDFEAILSEAELIRSYQPRFNVRLKDDKSPIYISITDEIFPRVLMIRKPEGRESGKKRTIFGPYPSAQQTRQVLQVIRHAFPFCNAKPSQKKQGKACFYFHLALCPGACVGKISEEAYARMIDNLRRFLLGKKQTVIRDLKRMMKQAVNTLDFEKAADLRDQMQAIEDVVNRRTSANGSDAVGYAPHRKDPRQELWSTLAPFYAKTNQIVPENPFRRVEAYDISNLSGKNATGAMVVFTDVIPDKTNYRMFKIRFSDRPDDLTMLSEVLFRRLRHREWPLPDLILIDGGKGQVKAAKQALAGYGLHHRIPIVGLAKRFEQLVIYKQRFYVLSIPKHSPVILFLMHVRDEAHRFARNYHRVLRERAFENTHKSNSN